MKKNLLIFLLSVFMVLAGSKTFASFTDIPKNHSNFNAISYAEKEGIVKGYADGTFRPSAKINRAEFTKIILEATLSNPKCNSESNGGFSDVRSDEWFAPYICQAKQLGIIRGYDDGTFRPGAPIKEAEAAKIAAEAFELRTTSASKLWYEPYFVILRTIDVLPPTMGNNPGRSINRGEMAELIYLMSSKRPRKKNEYRVEAKPQVTNKSLNKGSEKEGPLIGNCPVFPADNPWNTDISDFLVHPNSDAFINSIGRDIFLHADFGGKGEYGIPFITVGNGQKMMDIHFTAYGHESDPGPYPIPLNAPIEGGPDSEWDRHVLAVNTDTCMLYELYKAYPKGNSWDAEGGAVFNLRSNKLRPQYWTSADAAGLPIFAGLVRYDEVMSGEIKHALRFTVSSTQRGFIPPATHFASSKTDENLPPMGLRFRLKSDYDTSRFTGQARVILEALKKYGMIVADNGGDWFITGDGDPRWDDEDLNQLKTVPGSAFDAVYTGEIIK